MAYEHSFGYWKDTEITERQPSHTFDRALFGFGFAGGPMCTIDCPGCKWAEERGLSEGQQ